MQSTPLCPQCGQPLDDALDGLCPECLFAQGTAEPATEVHPQAIAPANLLSAEQLADCLPGLEVLRLAGFGGMGAVYIARQEKLDRIVAVKVLHPDSADDPSFAERFEREARAMAKLSHPNIVTIYDFDSMDVDLPHGKRRLFFIMMEYVSGEDLRSAMDRGMAPDQALHVVQQICEALQFAHDSGVVHRDIKPENILLDSNGRVRIADFGLAKLAERQPMEHSLTGTHQVVGTPKYMAPEQLEGARQIDHRADLYSLGVVFYEMLTGDLPLGRFELPSETASVDERMDGVILRSLAREPAKRFQQASEIRAEVRSLSGVQDAAVPPVRTPATRRERDLQPAHPSNQAEWSVPYNVALAALCLIGLMQVFFDWNCIVSDSPARHSFAGRFFLFPVCAATLSAALMMYTYVLTLSGTYFSLKRAIFAISIGLSLLMAVVLSGWTIPHFSRDEGLPLSAGVSQWPALKDVMDNAYHGRPAPIDVQAASGLYLAALAGIGIILLATWELAQTTRIRLAKMQSDPADNALANSMAGYLRKLAARQWLALLFVIPVLAYSVNVLPPPTRGFRALLGHFLGTHFYYATDLAILMFFLTVLTCLVTTCIYMLAAKRIEEHASTKLAHAACLAGLAPTSPVVIFSAPIAIWIEITRRAEAFRNRRQNAMLSTHEFFDRLDGIALRLRYVATANAIILIVVAIGSLGAAQLARTPMQSNDVLITGAVFLGLSFLPSAQLLLANTLHHRRSLGLAKFVAWFSLLPTGPGSLYSFPHSLDAIDCLNSRVRETKTTAELFGLDLPAGQVHPKGSKAE